MGADQEGRSSGGRVITERKPSVVATQEWAVQQCVCAGMWVCAGVRLCRHVGGCGRVCVHMATAPSSHPA